MRYTDLLRKLNDSPFQPFRIRLSNNSTIDVLEPGSVIVGKSSAVVPMEIARDDKGFRVATDWKTISISHIVELVNIHIKDGKRKRA